MRFLSGSHQRINACASWCLERAPRRAVATQVRLHRALLQYRMNLVAARTDVSQSWMVHQAIVMTKGSYDPNFEPFVQRIRTVDAVQMGGCKPNRCPFSCKRKSRHEEQCSTGTARAIVLEMRPCVLRVGRRSNPSELHVFHTCVCLPALASNFKCTEQSCSVVKLTPPPAV